MAWNSRYAVVISCSSACVGVSGTDGELLPHAPGEVLSVLISMVTGIYSLLDGLQLCWILLVDSPEGGTVSRGIQAVLLESLPAFF